MDPDASYPHDWSLGVWETIYTLKVTGTGTGDFEIAPAGWVPQELGWRDAIVNPRNITLVGSVTGYDFPTVVYDYVGQVMGQILVFRIRTVGRNLPTGMMHVVLHRQPPPLLVTIVLYLLV